MAPTSEIAELAQELDAYLEANPTTASEVHITGIGALWLQLMAYITESQIRGFLLAFTVIGALLCFIFKSLKIGLIAMAPNLSPAVLTLGVMGWIDLPLDYVIKGSLADLRFGAFPRIRERARPGRLPLPMVYR